MKLALAAVFAVMAFSAVAVSTASAFHPLFLTESKLELLFSGESRAGDVTRLRGLHAGILTTFECEKLLIHGFALNKSTLAHRIKILLHSKCQELFNGGTNPCTEPIHFKELLGELGLLLLTVGAKIAAILLRPSDGTNVIATVKCTVTTTTFLGSVIGEIPEINRNLVNQYNRPVAELEIVFRTQDQNLNLENQELTIINFLNMEQGGIFTADEFLEGKASLETSFIIKGDGKIEICTFADPKCP